MPMGLASVEMSKSAVDGWYPAKQIADCPLLTQRHHIFFREVLHIVLN